MMDDRRSAMSLHDRRLLGSLLIAALLSQATAQCGESCYYSSDMDCDDGGEGSEYNFCTLGSDCIDCGQRGDISPSAPPPPAPPIWPPHGPGEQQLLLLTDGAEHCQLINHGDCAQTREDDYNPPNYANDASCTVEATAPVLVTATACRTR